MSNQRDKGKARDGFSPQRARPGKAEPPRPALIGTERAPVLAKESGGASTEGFSGYTTPDTFVSLPHFRRNHLQTLQSASEQLDAYIRNFEGRSKDKYLSSYFASTSSSTSSPGRVFSELIGKMMEEGTLSNFNDSRSLIEWVNKAFKKELDRTCTPACENRRSKVVPDVTQGELIKHVMDLRSTWPTTSPLPSVGTVDYDDRHSTSTDVLLDGYKGRRDKPKNTKKHGKQSSYPQWVDALDCQESKVLNESRSSSVSKLFLSDSNSHVIKSTARPYKKHSESKTYAGPVSFVTDDLESVNTDVLLETSVYGHEPVNMGGALHTPLYEDKKVRKILENNRCKKKKHLPQNSLLSRSVHAFGSEDTWSYPYQFGQSQFSPASAKSRSFENIKQRVASTPLPNRAFDRARSQASTKAASDTRLGRPNLIQNDTPYPNKQPSHGRVSSSTNNFDALPGQTQGMDVRPQSWSKSEAAMARSPLRGSGRSSRLTNSKSLDWQTSPDCDALGSSRILVTAYSDNKPLVEDVSHKTSGYLSGTPSLRDSLRSPSSRDDAKKPVSGTPQIRKVSSSSEDSTVTDNIVRKSPTGIKYHSRSKSWNASDKVTRPGPRVFNVSAPSLGSVNVITKRLQLQKLRAAGSESHQSTVDKNGDIANTLQHEGLEKMSEVKRSDITPQRGSFSEEEGEELVLGHWVPAFPHAHVYESLSWKSQEGCSTVYEGQGMEGFAAEQQHTQDAKASALTSRVSPSTTSGRWREFHHPKYFHELGKRFYSEPRITTHPNRTAVEPHNTRVNGLVDSAERSRSSYHANRNDKIRTSTYIRESSSRPVYPGVNRLERTKKAISLMSETDSERYSVNTEVLLKQPPMPIVNASPSLSTVSDNDTLCDSESASSTYSEQEIVSMVDNRASPLAQLRDMNHNLSDKETLPRQYSQDHRTHSMMYDFSGPKASQFFESQESVPLNIKRVPDKGRADIQYDSLKAGDGIMDSFIMDCLKTAEQKNGYLSEDLVARSEKKLSGGPHPGPIEALKHMLLNLQSQTSLSLEDVQSSLDEGSIGLTTTMQQDRTQTTIHTYVKRRKTATTKRDGIDDNASLPGQQSLQRAYHHLERLKTLVHERSDRFSDSSGIE